MARSFSGNSRPEGRWEPVSLVNFRPADVSSMRQANQP